MQAFFVKFFRLDFKRAKKAGRCDQQLYFAKT